MSKTFGRTMWSVFSVVAFVSIFENVFAQNQNETTQNQTSNDFVGSGVTFAGNLSASISVSNDTDLANQNLDFPAGDGKVNISDRLQISEPAEKRENVVEFNLPSHQLNQTGVIKKLDNFRPSPQLETFYEYNKVPVKPAYPEAKAVPNYGIITADDKNTFSRGERLPSDNEKSRTITVLEPKYSSFAGNSNNYNNLVGPKPEYPGPTTGPTGPPWTPQTGKIEETPWISRVRFPTGPTTNYHNPYPFVGNPAGQNPTTACCQGNIGQAPHQHSESNNAQTNVGYKEYLPPLDTNNRAPVAHNNEYLSQSEGHNRPNNRGEYLLSVPNFSSPANKGHGESKDRYTSGFSSSGPGEEFNFNKLVEIPKKWFSGGHTSPHKTYETPYNLMEKPSYEIHQKTHGGGYGNAWKKILKLLATFIPIGLLISALTPTVITVTNVNDTQLEGSRYRSDDSKKQLHNHILSSLDYFDKLNENGCEYKVFCELLVTASRMPDSESHVQNLLDNFARQDTDYKSRAEELKKVFEAVRNQDCDPISCEFITNPT